MADRITLSDTRISIKVVGVRAPHDVNLKGTDDNGVWVQSEILHIELARLADQQGIPNYLKKDPLIFLPWHRIEWMMAAGSTGRPAKPYLRLPS